VVAACPKPRPPDPPRVRGTPWVRSLAAAAGTAAIRGVDAGDDGTVYVAIDRAAAPGGEPTLAVTALVDATAPARWEWTTAATGGPIASAKGRVVAAVAPRAGATSIPIGDTALATRGAPGAGLVGLDAATGAVAWTLPLGATEWSVVAAIDGTAGGDVIAVGSFAGTLRAGDRVVTAAGSSDGFALRVDAKGTVRWLVRMGGASADALTAVAVAPGTPERIAVAGSITGSADFRGTALAPRDAEADTTDVVVAALDPTGLPRWGRVHGGGGQDAAAGVAILASGAIAVAATVREVVNAGADLHVVRGTSDTLVVVHAADGHQVASTLIGGQDYDGARGLVVGPGDELVGGGWFAGVLRTPTGDVTAGGGDDAFVVRLARDASIYGFDIVTGPGREEVTALGGSSAGVAVAIGYTAAVTVAGTTLPAPADPGGGAAIVFFP
jgi:hypothetical protein